MHRDFLMHAKLCMFLPTNKMHFGDMRIKKMRRKTKCWTNLTLSNASLRKDFCDFPYVQCAFLDCKTKSACNPSESDLSSR